MLKNVLKLLTKKKWSFLLIFFALLAVAVLLYTGIIWPNDLFTSNYRVQGLDVSNHQKNIDWKRVAQTGQYSFVFIKATEGKSYRDSYFQANWRGTQEHGLLRGAYHFYTADLPGSEQAKNFIAMVPKERGMLPPVLDLEVSGKDRKVMLREIKVFLDLLEQRYGTKPVIYTDFDRYTEYIKGNFDKYALWINDVLTPPQLSGITNWTFWQYCDRCHVAGIPEAVDLNVFYGSKDKFHAMLTG